MSKPNASHISHVLHVVRNPDGRPGMEVREARIVLADAYERLAAKSGGLKDHQIAKLVGHLTAEMHSHWQLPEMLRQVISRTICEHLAAQGLRIDYPPTKRTKGVPDENTKATDQAVRNDDPVDGYRVGRVHPTRESHVTRCAECTKDCDCKRLQTCGNYIPRAANPEDLDGPESDRTAPRDSAKE
jgi:hypothetical protein